MPSARFLRIESFAEDGRSLSVCDLPVHTDMHFDDIMKKVSKDQSDASTLHARRARMSWVGSDGAESFWCAGWWTRPADFAVTASFENLGPQGVELAEAIKCLSKVVRETYPPAFIQTGPCAYALMPDFGSSALWTASGASSNLALSDARPGCRKNATRWEQQVLSWQNLFESHVDESSSEHATEGAPAFEWADFMGRAGCLALAARSVLRLPVRVRNPWENHKGKSEDWLPDWEATGVPAQDACRCLERLDQKGFAEALARGAVQAIDAPMPWATYCAHMGLPRALAALLKVRPESALFLCHWGSSAWSAALVRQDLACLEALAHGGGVVPDSFSARWPVHLAWRQPDSGKDEDALACLALLQRLAPMPSVPNFRSPTDSKSTLFKLITQALTAAWEAEQIGQVSVLPSPQSEASTGRARGAL